MGRYAQAFKDRAVARLLPPESEARRRPPGWTRRSPPRCWTKPPGASGAARRASSPSSSPAGARPQPRRSPSPRRPTSTRAETKADRKRITELERGILQVANEPRFAAVAPARIAPMLADEGTCLASEAIFRRVLRDHGTGSRGPGRPPGTQSAGPGQEPAPVERPDAQLVADRGRHPQPGAGRRHHRSPLAEQKAGAAP